MCVSGSQNSEGGIGVWKLKRIGFNGDVKQETLHPSGDSAKDNARRQQFRRDLLFDFKIYDPGGHLWATGRMKQCNGWRKMEWRS
jgi:hypothetical protein